MSRSRSIYSALTPAKFQADFSPIKPLRHKGETDELGIDNGTPLFAGLFRGTGDDLPAASRSGFGYGSRCDARRHRSAAG